MSISDRILLTRRVARLVRQRRLYRSMRMLHNPRTLHRFLFSNPLHHSHPVALQMEITSRCNFKCRYCIHHMMPERDKALGDMTMETFVDILDQHKSTQLVLHIQGQGEPFLHPKFEEMIKEAKRRGLYLLAFSNGSAWTKKNRKMILENGFDLLYLSFDIQSKEKMEASRQGMKYDKVVENFQNMVKERNEGRYSTVLALHGVVHASDLHEFEDRLLSIDKLMKPDLIIPTALAMPGADEKDYTQWYRRAGIDQDMILDLPKVVPYTRKTHAICISNREFYSRKSKPTCDKARFVYYRWDGTTSFCGERHTVDCDDPVTEVRAAMKQMQAGEVPSSCNMCQYLPPELFETSMREHEASHTCAGKAPVAV